MQTDNFSFLSGVQPHNNGQPMNSPWMMTFVDTIALVLTFFVLLFSMSTLEKAQFDSLSQTLKQRFKAESSQTGEKASGETDDTLSIFKRHAIDLGYLQTLLTTKMSQNEDLSGVTTNLHSDRLVISLPSDLLFSPGSASLNDGARKSIYILSTILNNVNNSIHIKGHTDPTPLNGGPFRDNWELSQARALSVAKQLKRAGYYRKLVAHGHADSFYSDTGSLGLDTTERNRLARRVDVIIYQDRPL